MKEHLLRKIADKTAVIGVIGLGYVGLPLAVEKAKAGYHVIGFDIQGKKVNMVNAGENYIGDIIDEDLIEVVSSGKLQATSDFSLLKGIDCVAICVPTPLDIYKQPDISFVKASSDSVAAYLHKDMLIVLESTTYPGTTEELLKPILEDESGLICGEDFYLAFSPERVDPGNMIYKTKNTPKVVGGVGRDSTEVAAALYRNVLQSEVFEVSCPAVAEMEKLLENTYRNVNIALANEMAIICDRMGINVWEVIDAAKTKPYGFQAFYPGPGVGGHCIPLDPFYLAWKAREYDYHTQLIEISGEINRYMPRYIVERAYRILNRLKKPLNGSRVLILGVAYKQDVDDYRESPAIEVIKALEKEAALVEYNDPHVPYFENNGKKYESRELSEQNIKKIDLVIITAMHTCYDYEFIQAHSAFILDTKNATKNVMNKSNIELL